MATNMFDKAKKTGATKKVEKHEVVNLPELADDVTKLADLNAKIAEMEAERAVLDGNIREAGKENMIKLYNKKKAFPGTLKIVAGEGSFQFITSDRYKKIDEDRFNELAETYSDDLVEESTKFSFNTATLMKHMEHISELLMSSKVLSEQDKETLLESETSYTVKKGTIKELISHVDGDVEGIIEDILPVFSIKSVQKDS